MNGTHYDGIVVPTETVAFYPEQIKSATDNIGTFDGAKSDIRYALPEGAYSYDTLVQKDDLHVITLPESVPVTSDGKIDNKAVVARGRLNARKQNNPHNTETNTYVRVDDIGLDVLVGAKGMQHGLARSKETALAVMRIGDVLKNSVAVNELNGSTARKTDMSYVLLGACREGESLYAVRSVVSKLQNDVTEIDVYQLNAVKGKKTEIPNSALKRGAAVTEQSSLISSGSPVVSIADFLQYVKDMPIINEIFSEDVAKKLGVNRSNGALSEDVRYALPEGDRVKLGREASRAAAVTDPGAREVECAQHQATFRYFSKNIRQVFCDAY